MEAALSTELSVRHDIYQASSAVEETFTEKLADARILKARPSIHL
jgi:hypothetical protein